VPSSASFAAAADDKRLPEIRHHAVRRQENRPHWAGISLASASGMSGPTVGRALHDRFDAIRRAELARLKKKLAGLSDDERQHVDAITADIIHAIARVPASALTEAKPPALEALVRLFALEPSVAR
jgi:hypothetical protein